MRRVDFEHVVHAASQISEEVEFVVIGSQAILGTDPNPPDDLQRSMELDIYRRDAPEKAEEIDGVLGDGSPFQRTYGYYAHGVGPETAKAPKGWEGRLILVEVSPRTASEQGAVARCLEAHDLVLAKCVRGDQRDWEFAQGALEAGLVEIEVLLDRVGDLPVDADQRDRISRMLMARTKAI
ncbi:MAG TPA: DUF6036 family nucleotidyltransferase [Solirubrobacterales bacterium]|jgi:hypothetical protein|nr:DUF6036 family nucleotidyltransferase [Solirubrobacterales bacterium]